MKQKKSIKTITRYIRDFSIVVAGIAVTLYVNSLVTHHGEKRDMKLYLSAVMLEMEENIALIDTRLESVQKQIEYAKYLKSHDKKSLDADTIQSYNGEDGYYNFSRFIYRKEAFEMFKISGSMRLVNDKQQLIGLWNVYTELEELKEGVNLFVQTKMEEAKKEIFWSNSNDFIPMYDFYTKTNILYEISQHYGRERERLEKTIEQLGKIADK